MPDHILIAHVAAMVAPIAGVLAVVYAAAPSTRRGLRWPLVVSGVLSAVLIVVASDAGHSLLDALRASGPIAKYEAAYQHAKSSDLAAIAAVVLAIVAPLAAWRFVPPDGAARRFGATARILLALSGIGLVAATAYTVALGLSAVWAVA